MLLPYLSVRAKWPAIALLAAACSFDGSGLISAGASSTGEGSSSTTTDGSSSTAGPTTNPPTTQSTDGTASDSGSTTTPVDPTTSTSTSTTITTTTGPDLTTSTTATATTEPDTDSTSWGGTTTSSTTEPDTSSTSTSTSTTTTTGDMCEDTGLEPNESEGQPVALNDLGCKDQPDHLEGVLNGSGDIDYYRYHGVFGGICNDMEPDPKPAVNVMASDSLRVCMFFECDQGGDENITCPMGTTANMSPNGLKGCCGAGSMMFALDCAGGGNESADVYIRLDQAPADACVTYSVDYSFHN